MSYPVEQSSPFENQRLEPRRYYGKYPGLVIDNAPADGEHRGEIQVQVPGILEETPDGRGQQPLDVIARPCFAPGFFFVPEIGAQVWVEFVAGDIDMPIWTGFWYPRDGVPPSSAEEAPTEHTKVYRSAAGHVVEMDNTEGEEQIVIKHKSRTAITIDKDGNLTIEQNDEPIVEIKDGNTIILNGIVQIVGSDNTKTTINGNQINGG